MDDPVRLVWRGIRWLVAFLLLSPVGSLGCNSLPARLLDQPLSSLSTFVIVASHQTREEEYRWLQVSRLLVLRYILFGNMVSASGRQSTPSGIKACLASAQRAVRLLLFYHSAGGLPLYIMIYYSLSAAMRFCYGRRFRGSCILLAKIRGRPSKF